MFRLLKLAAYALLGYALYEFFRGLSTQAEQAAREARGGRSGSSQQGGGRGQGLMGQAESFAHDIANETGQRLTGGGEGQHVETQNFDGGGVPHQVGRGVVHR